MSKNDDVLQAVLLSLLIGKYSGHRISQYHDPEGLHETVLGSLPDNGRGRDVDAGIWTLVTNRLAYLSFVVDRGTSKGIDAHVRLTEAGIQAADTANGNPDNPRIYWSRFKEVVPYASDVVYQYADEALRSYGSGCYLGATVLLGACSERVFLDTAEAFNTAIGLTPIASQIGFRNAYTRKTQNLKEMADRFHAAATDTNSQIPYPIREGIDNHWPGIFHLMRVARNDAGHPTGAEVTQADLRDYLLMLPHNLKRLYDLRAHCVSAGII